MSESAPVPLPAWTQRLGVFDLETTGVDVRTDRIVTAHVGVIDATGAVVSAQEWLADPGIPIPERAAQVHGITTEHARENGRSAAVVAGEVAAAVTALLSTGVPVVAFNAPFDFSLLRNELRRHAHPEPAAPTPVIDPLVLDKAFDRYRRGKRTLTDVAGHYGVALDDAHDAGADAVAAGRVALRILERYVTDLPDTAHQLHALQVAWAAEQAERLSAYFAGKGRADSHVDGRWPVR